MSQTPLWTTTLNVRRPCTTFWTTDQFSALKKRLFLFLAVHGLSPLFLWIVFVSWIDTGRRAALSEATIFCALQVCWTFITFIALESRKAWWLHGTFSLDWIQLRKCLCWASTTTTKNSRPGKFSFTTVLWLELLDRRKSIRHESVVGYSYHVG